MSVIIDVLKELFSMFVGDALLTFAILILVALVAFGLYALPAASPILWGVVLIGGCLAIIVAITTLHARRAGKGK